MDLRLCYYGLVVELELESRVFLTAVLVAAA